MLHTTAALLTIAVSMTSWTQHASLNCYSGHGGKDLDNGHGCGTMSLIDCQAKCNALPACTGVTVASGANVTVCFRRGNITLENCVAGQYNTWTRGPSPNPAPNPPNPPPQELVPGLADVCANLPAAERCSPEICNMTAGSVVRLEARDYYQDRSVLLPPRSRLIGAGINKTVVIACGAPSSGRRGFILNNNSYLGHFTWQGLQATRGNFDAAVGTPGCLLSDCTGAAAGGCIPHGGDCSGVENATAEHILNRPFDGVYEGRPSRWPLSSSAGWFPKTVPWGPDRKTGSRNITIRGIISWGSWADGINFHGGHHNVLIEQCEMNYAGDDAYGLWPVSTDAVANPEVNCQRNIVLRNNVARWPRQVQTARSVAGGKGPLAYPDCDCAHYPSGTTCYSKPCYATYAGGAGVQWVNNRCEGSVRPINFNPGYPSNPSKWCGVLAVAGNSYASMAGQGSGCRLNGSTAPFCRDGGSQGPPFSIGGQCETDEAKLPPACADSPRFAACRAAAGVGGICFNATGPVLCVDAATLAETALAPCRGFAGKCTIYS